MRADIAFYCKTFAILITCKCNFVISHVHICAFHWPWDTFYYDFSSVLIFVFVVVVDGVFVIVVVVVVGMVCVDWSGWRRL